MKKRLLSLLMIVAMMTTLLVGCGEKTKDETEGEKIHLTYLNGAGELVDFWNEFFEEYNANNDDNIEVEVIYDESSETLQVMMASGETPDLITTDITTDMIDAGKFEDLTDMSVWEDFYPEVKEYATYAADGRAYSVPLLMSAVGLFYNEEIFEEVGITPAYTWDEFVNNLRAIKEKNPDVTPMYIGGGDAWMLGHMAEFWQWGASKQQFGLQEQQQLMLDSELEKLGITTEEDSVMAIWAERLMQLMDEGLINANAATDTYTTQNEAFAAGEVGIISAGLWTATELEDLMDDTSIVGFSQYPALIDGMKATVGSSADCYVRISSESENVDAAKKVLEYMCKPESLEALSLAKQSPAANPDVVTDWGFLQEGVSAVLSDEEVVQLTWTCGSWPTGFGNDDHGRVTQELLAGAYDTPVDFAKAYIDAWNAGLN